MGGSGAGGGERDWLLVIDPWAVEVKIVTRVSTSVEKGIVIELLKDC